MNEVKFLEYSPDQIYILDDRFFIKYRNKAAEKYGFHNNDKDKPLYDLCQNSENLCSLLKKTELYGSVNNYEIITDSNEGKKQFGLITAAVIKNDSTGSREYVVFIKDMTAGIQDYSGQIQSNLELITLNEKLKQNQTQLIMQDKLASIGQLSAGIAHEINNPLSYIFSNFDMLYSYMKNIKDFIYSFRDLYSIDDNNEIRKKIAELKKIDVNFDFDFIFSDSIEIREETMTGMMKVKKIIDSLAHFSQKNVLMKQDLLDVNKSIEEMLVITRNEYKRNIEVSTDFESIPEIYCIPAEINQVLLNIFINSIEAVNSNEKDVIGQISIRTYEKNNYIYIEISDNGAGIPANIKNKIFDPFFTTKKTGEGIGIGLTIVHDIIVNNHQGSIEVQNIENGIKVIIGLPCIEYLGGQADEA